MMELQRLIKQQESYPGMLAHMCRIISQNYIDDAELETLKQTATIISKNRRHLILKQGPSLIKIKQQSSRQMHRCTTYNYENNFGDLSSLLPFLTSRDTKDKLALSLIENILNKICKLVYNVHAMGWSHKDIKPENILICPIDDKCWEPFVEAQENINTQQKTESNKHKYDTKFDLFFLNIINCNEKTQSIKKFSLFKDSETCTVGKRFFLDILFKNKFILKLCDFEFMTTKNKVEAAHGTLGYLSVNQLHYQEQKSTTQSDNPACDQYSLGMTIFKTLLYNEWKEYKNKIEDNRGIKQRKTAITELRLKAKYKIIDKKLQTLLDLAIALTDSSSEYRLKSFIQYHNNTIYKPRRNCILMCCMRTANTTINAPK